MKFIADANVETVIVQWLRSIGHDVVWAVELSHSFTDSEILNLANQEKRILLTYDRDFGDLVFRRRLATEGVILLRMQSPLQTERFSTLKNYWDTLERCLGGHFIVVSDHKIRIRPLP